MAGRQAHHVGAGHDEELRHGALNHVHRKLTGRNRQLELIFQGRRAVRVRLRARPSKVSVEPRFDPNAHLAIVPTLALNEPTFKPRCISPRKSDPVVTHTACAKGLLEVLGPFVFTRT